jgi:hypothetical protein
MSVLNISPDSHLHPLKIQFPSSRRPRIGFWP